jgi:FKBP-type peptidyl-prolyl cis-trans isomerase FklB
MANEDKNNLSEENEQPADAEPQSEGLSADELAERPYDEGDAWNKSKNSLFGTLGLIALAVAGYTFFQNQSNEEDAERSRRFLEASSQTEGAEERFLSFADDYDDALGGVAKYRAAILQYKDARFEESAKSFADAASRLEGQPLFGRARLGYAVSLIKSGSGVDAGKSALTALSSNGQALDVDRWEAHYLLAVQSMTEENDENFSTHRDALAADQNASDFLSRLEEFRKTQKFLDIAQSLPDLNADKAAKFLAENAKHEGVTQLESGLQYEIMTKGDGEVHPTAEDEVEVHYHGTLISGEVFDSSVDRGEPAKFRLNGVIKGWTEALQLMKAGDKWKLFIPSELAYGESGNNSIGPNEALIFEVELLSITVEEEPEPALDANASDANSSSAEAPLVIPGVDANATAPVVEENATVPSEGNGSE